MSRSDEEWQPKQKRTWTRRASNTMPRSTDDIGKPANQGQLRHLAFNIHGWALEDGMHNRGTFEVINANPATMVTGGFEAKIEELTKTPRGCTEIYRPQLKYTRRELDAKLHEHDDCVVQYLVVGYMLQHDDPLYDRELYKARNSEGELVGRNFPAAEHIIPWNICKTPVLVVTPLKRNTGTSVRLFALISQRSGLCLPALIKHDRVFYRWEFRTDSGIKPAQRNKNWNQCVIYMALNLLPGYARNTFPDVQTPKRIKLEDDSSISTFTVGRSPMFEPKPSKDIFGALSFTLDLDFDQIFGCHLQQRAGYDIGRQYQLKSKVEVVLSDPAVPAILKHIRRTNSNRLQAESEHLLLDVERSDISESLQRMSIVKLCDFTSEFTMLDANHAAKDMQVLWPTCAESASAENVQRMRSVLQLQLELNWHDFRYEGLKCMLYSGLRGLSSNPNMQDSDLARVMLESLLDPRVGTLMSTVFTNDPPSLGDDTILLLAILRDTIAINRWQIRCFSDIKFCHLSPFSSIVGQDTRYTMEIAIGDARQNIRTIAFDLMQSVNPGENMIETVLGWVFKLRKILQDL